MIVEVELADIITLLVEHRDEARARVHNRGLYLMERSYLARGKGNGNSICRSPFRWPIPNALKGHKRMIPKLHKRPPGNHKLGEAVRIYNDKN